MKKRRNFKEEGEKQPFKVKLKSGECRKSQGINLKIPRTSVCSKVTGYKVNTQKSIIFLHSSNEQLKTKIKSTISFIIVQNIETFRYNPNKICTGSIC